MTGSANNDPQTPLPLLMRFLVPLEQFPAAVVYDHQARLNVLAGQSIPAVQAGLDVKTMGAVAED